MWIDGRMDRWMDGDDEQMDRWIDVRQMYDGCTMDGWMDGWAGGRLDSRDCDPSEPLNKLQQVQGRSWEQHTAEQ